MERTDRMIKALGIVALMSLAACNSTGTYYPEYGTQTSSSTSNSGITVSGSVRTGLVYSSR